MAIKNLLPVLFAIVLWRPAATAEATFNISTRNEAIPENGTVICTVLKTGENEFTFLPPPQWKPEVDRKTSSMAWTAPDYRSMIQLRLIAGASNAVPALKPGELKKVLLSRHSHARILEEFPCHTAGLSGVAFDWDRPGEGGFVIRARSAFIPVAGGIAELTLTTPSTQFEARHMDLMRLLNSLRVANPVTPPGRPITRP